MKRRQLDRLLDDIRYNTTRQPTDARYPSAGRTAIDQLLARAVAAVTAAFTASARPDGFPTSTPGAGNPGGGKNARRLMAIEVDDEPRTDGTSPAVDLVPTSSTEAAALAGSSVVDTPASMGRRIVRAVEDVAASLNRLGHELDRWDRYRKVGEVPDPPMCTVAQMRGLPYDPTWDVYRRTDFASRLTPAWPEPRPVSKFVHTFVWHHHRLPTADEMRKYLERGVVKQQAG